MKQEERDAWNARVPVVTHSYHCERCKTLQPAVRLRTKVYPYVALISCDPCFVAAVEKAGKTVDYYTDFGI